MRGNSVDPGRLATVDGQRRPSYVVRRARTADVAAHPRLVDAYSASRILLSKATVTLYEDVQEFWVADTPESGGVIGCGALHVMLGRPRRGSHAGHGPSWDRSRRGECRAGTTVSVADELGVARVFCLTCEVDVFAGSGFEVCSRARRSSPRGMRSCRVSYDEGVAEFLDLDRVKPNTLGDTRMLRTL